MASGLSKLKHKLKDRDLDDEFEKFLNESLSDESATSPRRSLTPQGSKSKLLAQQKTGNNFEKPWWATSEDEDSSAAVQKLRTKDQIADEELKSSLQTTKDSIDYTSRPGTALDTILSEPEYSSGHEEKKKSPDTSPENVRNDDISEASGDDLVSNSEQQSPVHPIESSTENAVGFETLEEVKDKEAFFSDIEKTGDVNYRELNQHFDEGEQENIVNTEVSVGIDGLTPYRPPYYDDDDSSSEDYDEKTEEKPVTHSEHGLNEQQLAPNTSNLLSKVALMESLETTGGFNLPQKKIESSKKVEQQTVFPAESDVVTAEVLKQVDTNQPSSSREDLMADSMLDTTVPVASGMLMFDKDGDHQSSVDPFHLQPVVSNFIDEPRVIDSSSFINQDSSDFQLQFQQEDGKKGETDTDRGFDLQPISALLHSDEGSVSPPTESLKSIKTIAEERKKKVGEKTTNFPSTINNKPKDKSKAKSRIPTHTVSKQSSIHSTKKQRPSVTLKKNVKRPKSSKCNEPDSTTKLAPTQNLISSVESFANYLKTVSSTDEGHRDNKSPAHNLEWRISNLEREKRLQSQLQELRVENATERENNERLAHLLETQNQNFEKEKMTLTFQYEKKMKRLEEQVFVLTKKLELERDDKSSTANFKNKDSSVITEEELKLMQRQLEQQESLLSGYQVENEKLCAEIKKVQSENKKFETKMFSENQLLLTQNSNLKEELEARPNIDLLNNSGTLGANRIVQLENQIRYYKQREAEHKENMLTLESEVSALKIKLRAKHSTWSENDSQKQIELMKVNHQVEVSKLHKRLQWYAENQHLLDKDVSEIRAKRSEVKELRELVERLENESRKLKKEFEDRRGEKNSDFKRIQDLTRQVKEMEEIIRKRHPNSLPAILYAASSIPMEKKVCESMEGDKSGLTFTFLENRMKSLEKELEEKDDDHSKKIRAIEQKSSAMCVHYEAHIKQLEDKISTLTLRLKSEKTLEEVEVQVAKTKRDYEHLSEQFRKDLIEKDREITKLKLEKKEKRSRVNAPSLQRDMSKLREKLREKEKEISQLNKTVCLLENRKENIMPKIIVDRGRKTDKSMDYEKNQNYCTDRATSPVSSFHEAYVKSKCMEGENARLRARLEELLLELEEKRLKFEACEAKRLQEIRTFREGQDETLKTIEQNHQHELQKLRMEFLAEHSNSKVAELSAKIKGHELMIEHLKSCLQESKLDREKYMSTKLAEKSLREEIQNLKTQLNEERTFYTPEMHHYKTLETKIRSLESRYFAREQEMRNIMEKNKHCSTIDIRHIEDKWRDILRNKDLQIHQFREELDSILEIMQELQRRIFPKSVTSR